MKPAGLIMVYFNPVVLERVPPGSLREVGGSLFHGRIEEEKLWMTKHTFLLLVYSTNKKRHDVGLDGNVYGMQGQAALTALTDVLRVCVVRNRLLFLQSM